MERRRHHREPDHRPRGRPRVPDRRALRDPMRRGCFTSRSGAQGRRFRPVRSGAPSPVTGTQLGGSLAGKLSRESSSTGSGVFLATVFGFFAASFGFLMVAFDFFVADFLAAAFGFFAIERRPLVADLTALRFFIAKSFPY